MVAKVCETCGTPIKKLKHSSLCQCGPKILSNQFSDKTKK